MHELRRKLDNEMEDKKAARGPKVRELENLTSQNASALQQSKLELRSKLRYIASVNNQMEAMKSDLYRERKYTNDLRHNLDMASSN